MNKRTELPYELVSDHICLCGEGPLWDSLHKHLYWIDIVQGEINCYLPENKQIRHFNTGQKIGAIALSESGNLIAALKDGIYKIDFAGATMVKLFDPDPISPTTDSMTGNATLREGFG